MDTKHWGVWEAGGRSRGEKKKDICTTPCNILSNNNKKYIYTVWTVSEQILQGKKGEFNTK